MVVTIQMLRDKLEIKILLTQKVSCLDNLLQYLVNLIISYSTLVLFFNN